MRHHGCMGYERLWERLLEVLQDLGSTTEAEPGRIKVELRDVDGSSRIVEIVMTRTEWDNMVTIPWGDFDAAARQVTQSLLGLRNDQHYLVYGDYELVPAVTPHLITEVDSPSGEGRWRHEKE